MTDEVAGAPPAATEAPADPATAAPAVPATPAPPRWRVGLLLWLAGMLGVGAITMLPLPPSVAEETRQLPLRLVQVVGLIQSGLILALAVALGTRVAPRVALAAPVFEALAARAGAWPALRPQLVPGTVGALLGGLVLLAFRQRAPSAVTSAVANGFDPSLLVRVLYGGITEELLLRWCVMTLLLWCFAPGARRRGRRPGRIAATAAIVGSALLFGLGHLPTIVAYGGALTRDVVLWTLAGNAIFGVVTGVLFRTRGLEAAMVAHGLAHVVAFLV